MATPVDNPQGPEQGTGAPGAGAPAPEPPQPPAGAPVGHDGPALAPSPDGLPGAPGLDGVQVSGRGSNQDNPLTPAAPPDTPSPEVQPGTPRQEVSDLPEWAQTLIKDTREEVAKTRVNAKQAAADEAKKQMAHDIGRALGIINDDTPPEDQLTPEQLKDLLAGERNTARSARTELAVFKAAQGGGGFNVAALLDSRQFLDSIKDVDPNDGEALAAKIAEAVTAQPWLAAPTAPEPVPATAPGQPVPVPVAPAVVSPVAPPSGGQFAGGPGAQPQELASMSIDDFRRLRRTPRP